jgi:hypothetical protein
VAILVAAVTFVVVVASEMVLELVVVFETVPRCAAGSRSRIGFTIESGNFGAGADNAPRRFHGSFRPRDRSIEDPPAHFNQCLQIQVQKLISNAH